MSELGDQDEAAGDGPAFQQAVRLDDLGQRERRGDGAELAGLGQAGQVGDVGSGPLAGRPFGVRVTVLEPGGVAATNFAATEAATWPQGQGPYDTFRRNHHERMAHFNRAGAPGLSTPEDVATVVVKAVTAARPKARYKIGVAPRLMPALPRLMPALPPAHAGVPPAHAGAVPGTAGTDLGRDLGPPIPGELMD